MIIVTGTVVAKPESFDALLAESLAHVARSRAEDGCLSHAVTRDFEDPLRLFFFEQWRDRSALDVHFRQPGSIAFVAALPEVVSAAGTLQIYEAQPV